MQKIELSICIVSFKDVTKLRKTLQSIYKNKPLISFEIIVVDNCVEKTTPPSILKNYPKVTYIKARNNGGYGAGNNLAVRNSTGKFVLILNPDTQVEVGTIQKLYDFLKTHKNAAGVGPAYQTTRNKLVPLGTGELTPLRGIFALGILNKLFPKNRFSLKYYLSDKERRIPCQVWAIPGSIGMFRKDALIHAGLYDENLFLYYEESDLGRRLKDQKWELWITPDVNVKHDTGGSTSRVDNRKIKEIFENSRSYYFRKHFGFFNSIIVDIFSKFGKYEATFTTIFLLGLFLRLFRISENLVFHGELGDNYLSMKNILTTGVVPLIGPPTSHSWLSFGPLFYWIFTPILLIGRFNPLFMSFVFALIGSTLSLLNFYFVSKIYDKRVALISSFIVSVSPAMISFTREARFFSLILPLSYVFFYSLYKKKSFFGGFLLGVIFNFHLSPLVYLPVVIPYIYKVNKIKGVRRFLLGIFVPSVPFLLSSLLNGGYSLFSAIAWIPYRVLGFLGIVHKNTISSHVITHSARTLLDFASNMIVINGAWILLFIIGVFLIKGKRTLESQFTNLLLTIIAVGLLGIFIHGDAPIHYYLPLYIPIIIFSAYVISLLNKRIIFCFGILSLVVNLQYLLKEGWFYTDQLPIKQGGLVPYNLQIDATNSIIADVGLYPYSIKRIGPYDNFEHEYAQNYIYLLWLKGNEPVNDQLVTYHIYENAKPSSAETVIYSKGGLTVSR